MYFLAKVWAIFTGITTFHPFGTGGHEQTLLGSSPRIGRLQVPESFSSPQIVSAVDLSSLPDVSSIPESPPEYGGQTAPKTSFELPEMTSFQGPPKSLIFPAPGGDGFLCNYSAMVGWEPCSTPHDRSCWLRKKDGLEKPFDVFTDYENRKPTGVVRPYEFNLTDEMFDADGIMFPDGKFFNGKYPGPWIQACWGDTIKVRVHNKLHFNGTSVHWHGIRQLGSVEVDGVNGVTQCPIAPGEYMDYEFDTWQYGSSWYHSHYSVQYADGAAGPMTIHGPTLAPWDEAISPPLIMTDWSHRSAFDGVMDSRRILYPDILLNGRGNATKFNKKYPKQTPPEKPYSITFEKVKTGHKVKQYLLRLINTSYDTTFVFSIDHHNFTVVEADFVPVHPYSTHYIMVGIGQRYDVVVDAWPYVYSEDDKLPESGNFWIRTFVAENCFARFKPPTGSKGYEETGILRYDPSSTEDPTTVHWPDIPIPFKCIDPATYDYSDLRPVLDWDIPKIPGFSFNDTPTLDDINAAFWEKDAPYPLAKWTLGASVKSTVSMRVDYSRPVLLELDKPSWPDPWRVQPIIYDSTARPEHWVYLVIESKLGAHPMHLHGHDYSILDAQNYKYNPENITKTLKYSQRPRRDVVMLPYEKSRGGGYVVIAFKVDNPGPWIMHCHIAFHISEGLGMQFLEDPKRSKELWPYKGSRMKETRRVCDGWNKWYAKKENRYPEPECKWPEDQCFQNDSGV